MTSSKRPVAKFKLSIIMGVCLILATFLSTFIMTGCESDSEDNSSLLTLVGTQLGSGGSAVRISVTSTATGFGKFPGSSTSARDIQEKITRADITPEEYKLALVNFWLINETGEEVNVLNPDSDNSTYTEDNPIIMSFSSNSQLELLNNAELAEGTYTGYKMQFLYIQMKFPVYFHFPSFCVETDYSNASAIENDGVSRLFRLYFNAIGYYWKRDFVVELDADTGQWYWMRRVVESTGNKNFFIKVLTTSDTHPPGGAGTDSVLDLFADEEFWGTEADLNNNENPIIVGTHSEAGGVNCFLTTPIIITADSTTIDIGVDVSNTMSYSDSTSLAAGEDEPHTNALDLGPNVSGVDDPYGDIGLHPMMPRFTVESE